MKRFIVVQLDRKNFFICSSSDLPGVDYRVDLGGFDQTTAMQVVEELNSRYEVRILADGHAKNRLHLGRRCKSKRRKT